MRIIYIVTALLVALAMPAWASECPLRIAALDEHLQQHGSSLSAEKAAEVKQLRDQAEQAHGAGDHAAAMQAVQQAEKAAGM